MLAGCGGGDPPAPAQPTPTIATDEESVEAIEAHLQELTRRKEAAKRAGDTAEVDRLEKEMQAIERELDAAVEEEFASDSGYEKALDRLPLHVPPLYVDQLVVDDTHELVVRVKERRFLCEGSPDERLAAVRSYYEAAREEMEAQGVTDFVMVVDGLRETGVVKPLARASADGVSLTARGRDAGRC